MKQSPISPWVRPVLLGAVGFITIGVGLIVGVVEYVSPGNGARVGAAIAGYLAQVPEAWVDLFRDMFAVYAIAKTGQIGVQAYASAKYNPPMRANAEDEKKPDHEGPG